MIFKKGSQYPCALSISAYDAVIDKLKIGWIESSLQTFMPRTVGNIDNFRLINNM